MADHGMFNDPTFWVTAAFFIFLAIALKPLIRIIRDGLDKRASQIAEELERAVDLREEAQVMLAKYQKKQRE